MNRLEKIEKRLKKKPDPYVQLLVCQAKEDIDEGVTGTYIDYLLGEAGGDDEDDFEEAMEEAAHD